VGVLCVDWVIPHSLMVGLDGFALGSIGGGGRELEREFEEWPGSRQVWMVKEL